MSISGVSWDDRLILKDRAPIPTLIGWGFRCAASGCNLAFDLAVVTLTFKILSGYISESEKCRN